MNAALDSAIDRLRANPGVRWAAAASCALQNAPIVGYLVWLKQSGELKSVFVFCALVFAVHAWLVAGILCRWTMACITAQWTAGLSALGAVILLYKSFPAHGRDDVNVGFVIGSLVLFVVQFALVTLAKPPRTAESPLDPSTKKSGDPLDWSRDNIEAIVVAFLMALIIRCFCVEVFKIPTGSMEPTLYGDAKEDPPHSGDRIMVDKVGLILHGVNRFDVCVFKYPLDRSRNFIKRIVGLSDEDLRVDHGDIWTRPHSGGDGNFHIARKPPHDQAGIWLPAWPTGETTAAAGKHDWDGAPDGCYLEGASFDTGPAKGEAVFRLQAPVKDSYRGKGTNSRVNDLVLRFRATMAPGAELYVTDARSDGYGRFTAAIAQNGTVTLTRLSDEHGTFVPLPPPAPFSIGAIEPGTDLEVAFFDGSVRVRAAGREVGAWDYLDTLPEVLHLPDVSPFMISFGSRGGAVKFEGVWLGRDILYNESGSSGGESALTGKAFIAIPKDHYLAIGDNVCNSKDGRLWKERVIKLKNGETWSGDGDSPENWPQNSTDYGLQRFRDIDGTDHFFMEDDVLDRGDNSRSKWHPFVSKEELVGKALIVWWPLPRFKLIR